MNEPTIPWQELVAILWRNRLLIAVVSIVGVATVTVLAWLQPPSYRASAKLMVTSSRATMTVSPDANERPRIDPVSESDLSSEVTMLSSPSLLREVLEPYRDRLEPAAPATGFLASAKALVTYPLSLPNRVYRSIHSLPADSPLDQWVADTAAHLGVVQLGRSNLVEVAFENRRPDWAAELVNSLLEHHVGRHVRMNQQTSAQQFYESQRELLTQKLSAAEVAQREFYQRESIDSATKGVEELRARVSELETGLADAETELAESSAEADFLTRAMTTAPHRGNAIAGGGAPMSGGSLIKNRIVELELQRSQLLSQYAPTSMKVSDLDRQIAEARRLLQEEKLNAVAADDPARQTIEANLTQTQARAAALKARAASLREQLESGRTELAHLDSIASEQERIAQEVNSAKGSLATYLKKEEEARFANALDESRIVNVTIVDRAVVPSVPLQSKRTMTILLGSIVSLAVGLGLAFVRDRLDPSIKSGSEARRISGLSVVAEIPS